jgi:hypothetical protein
METLKQFCDKEKLNYHTVYQQYSRGKLSDIQVEKVGRNLFVKPKQNSSLQVVQKASEFASKLAMPREIKLSDGSNLSMASTRKNAVSKDSRSEDRFSNISNGFLPFSSNGTGDNSGISCRDVVVLCQRAYFNFSSISQIINVMVEFSSSNIYLTGGNKQSKDFFYNYFTAINLPSLEQRFFREYYRSANVFIYPLMGRLKSDEITKLKKTFDLNLAAKIEIPVKYIILNPADIIVDGSASFIQPIYYKRLNTYELARLRNPQTDSDKEIINSLPPEIKELIKGDKKTKNQVIDIPLSTDQIYAVFNNKQDYEPFGVSMIFPVLDDLEWKQELKNIDKAISRTISQVVLLVKTGYENKNGEYIYNQDVADAYEEIFKNQSVGRVIVGDFALDAKFVIPDIGDILTPEKYNVVNEDIRAGLNDILFGSNSEKFANQSIKVQVFMERLNKARQVFINDFLYPEMQKIAKTMNFKACPKPNFEDIDLKDSLSWGQLYAQLAQYGVLSPQETINAIETGILPNEDESIENQRKYRQSRDEGLYEPITGGPNTQLKLSEQKAAQQEAKNKLKKPNGRPAGTKKPQSTKKISPIGTASENKELFFSAKNIKFNLTLADQVQKAIAKSLSKKYKVKKLTSEQESVVSDICDVIVANEEPHKWMDSIEDYIKEPLDKNPERVKLIEEISYKHQVTPFIAGILLASKTEKPENK